MLSWISRYAIMDFKICHHGLHFSIFFFEIFFFWKIFFFVKNSPETPSSWRECIKNPKLSIQTVKNRFHAFLRAHRSRNRLIFFYFAAIFFKKIEFDPKNGGLNECWELFWWFHCIPQVIYSRNGPLFQVFSMSVTNFTAIKVSLMKIIGKSEIRAVKMAANRGFSRKIDFFSLLCFLVINTPKKVVAPMIWDIDLKNTPLCTPLFINTKDNFKQCISTCFLT